MTDAIRRPLVLLTALAALAAGALNGRVLCLAGDGHVAVEEPHCAGHQSCGHAEHAAAARVVAADLAHADHVHDDGSDHARHGGDGPAPEQCVDVEVDVDLVRESRPAGLDHRDVQAVFAFLPSPAFVTLALVERVPPHVGTLGDSPPDGDLARLRGIILLT